MHRQLGNTPLGWQDYLVLPADGRRYEIIEGELHVTPAPVARHQWVSSNLELMLRLYVKPRGLGVVLHAPIDVILDEHTIVQPDIIFVAAGRVGIIKDQVEGAPDLVVEILSPSSARTDRHVKGHVYARAGVRTYWIVDPDGEMIEEHVLGAGGYELCARRGAAESFEPRAFPGLVIDLAEVWKL